jgi:acyl-CoA synthetase (AMP-forming)/AMP-acid ligase II
MYVSLVSSLSKAVLQVTYSELDRLTKELATKLCHMGVKTNVIVGILMDHCLEYVVSYIAILRAG